MDLTDEGLKHRDDVADAIFAFMHKMRDEEGTGTVAIPPYVYQEVRPLRALLLSTKCVPNLNPNVSIIDGNPL